MSKRLTIATLAVLLLVGPWLAGCETALFPDNLARSPYERYNEQRGRSQPATEQDIFGADRAALRDRLKPLDRQ